MVFGTFDNIWTHFCPMLLVIKWAKFDKKNNYKYRAPCSRGHKQALPYIFNGATPAAQNCPPTLERNCLHILDVL